MIILRTTAVFLLLQLVETSKAQSVEQVLYLYSGTNGTGSHVKIEEKYIENLADIAFDDQTISICLTGIWILYEDKSYNPAGERGVEYYFGRGNACKNLGSLQNKVSSVRYAGAAKDYRTDSLTLYSHTNFQGTEEYILTQSSTLSLNEGYGSIIITGNSYWTIFDKPNFQGNSICLMVAEPGVGSPAFLYDIEKNELISSRLIKSVKKGCVNARDDGKFGE